MVRAFRTTKAYEAPVSWARPMTMRLHAPQAHTTTHKTKTHLIFSPTRAHKAPFSSATWPPSSNGADESSPTPGFNRRRLLSSEEVFSVDKTTNLRRRFSFLGEGHARIGPPPPPPPAPRSNPRARRPA